MKQAVRILTVLLALGCCSSQPFETLKQDANSVWKPIGRAPGDVPLRLQIVLTLPDTNAIEQHALQISDPSHPRWRSHLSPDHVARLTKPHESTLGLVETWLTGADVPFFWKHGGAFTIQPTVSQAEVLLNTTFNVYESTGGQTAVRTEEYYVPEHLQNSVDFVTPTVHFPLTFRSNSLGRHSSANQPSRRAQLLGKRQYTNSSDQFNGACGNSTVSEITPQCVRDVYAVDWKTQDSNTSFAIFDVDDSTYNASDTSIYLKYFNPEAYAAQAQFETINVAQPRPDTGGESTLDLELSLGIAWPAKGIFYQYNGDGFLGPFGLTLNASQIAASQDSFLEFLTELAHNDTVPSVISLSAGNNEGGVSQRYARRVCHLIAAAGARGVTFVAASGDNGPVGQPITQHNTTVDPDFPAGCPFVTAVGATINPFNETGAVGRFTSGGGFSTIFDRPSYQDAFVPPYIKKYVSPAFQNYTGFNASGRGFPDISALGGPNVPTITQGLNESAAGTSASAPVIAALVALLNDYEASRGKPPLGFLNPLLYSLKYGQGLRDITIGDGTDYHPIGSESPVPYSGYNATVGWDALTGLGVLEFDKLRAALP